jgi:hypothetical protein
MAWRAAGRAALTVIKTLSAITAYVSNARQQALCANLPKLRPLDNHEP